MNRFFGCPLPRWNRTASVGRHVLAVAAAVAGSAGLCPAASNLEFTVHAIGAQGTQDGTIAPGSGLAYNVPDGRFSSPLGLPDFQFGRPVATNRLVAFRGTAQYTPPPQVDGGGIGRGLWGGNDPLHTVVVGQFGATGTPGGFTGEFGTIALDVAGDLAFTGAWVKTTPPASSGTGIWYSTAHVSLGDLTAVAVSGQDAPGTGGQFGNLNAGPLFQNVGYIAFISGGHGNWTFNKATQQLQRVSYVGMSVPIFGPGLTLIGGAGLVGAGEVLGLTNNGQLLLRATTSDNRTRLFLASAPDAITPIFSTGDDAPGLPGKRIGSMGAGVNIAGDVAILTRLDDGDANVFNDTSALYLRRSTGAMELVTHGGAPLTDMPTGIWGGSPLINDPRHIFLPGIGIIDPFGGPGATPVFTAIPAIPLPPPPPPPELPPPQPSVSGWSFNDLDQVAAFLTYGSGTQHSLWFYQAGDGWTKVAEIGTALQLSPLPAPAVQVSTIGYVHNSGGSDGKPTGLSNAGELVFSINGSHVVSARVVAPDITVESGTELFDEYIPQINKLTITGGTATFEEGVGTVLTLEQTGGTLNIEKGDTTVEDASISDGTISGDASMTIEESAHIIGEAVIWLRELILKNGVSLRGALQLAAGTSVVFGGGSALDTIVALDGDVRLWGEGAFINRGTIVNGEEGDDPAESTARIEADFAQADDGTFVNYRTVEATKRFDVGGSFANFGNLAVSWQGSGTAPESSFAFLENFGKLSVTDGASVRLQSVAWDLSSSLEISHARVTYEGGDDAVTLPTFSMDEEAELRFPATYGPTRAFDVGDMTVSGPGNTISAPANTSPRVQVDVQDKVTYFSPTFTGFRLRNVVYQPKGSATITNEGPVQFDLFNSAFTSFASWTLGADVNVNVEDKLSYFGTAATLKIPQGRIFTITEGEEPGKVYGLPGAAIHLDGVLNGDLGLYGAFNSKRIPDWTGYYPDRPLPTYLNIAQSPGDGTINGDVTLGRLATLVCELAGTQQGVTYDHLDVNGTLTINGGLLDVRFLDGFENAVQPGDVFVLVEAATPIAGSFVNAPSGTRRNTGDGLRSFEIFYGDGSPHGANRVVATNVGALESSAVPPTIATQPAAQNANAGDKPTFTVIASGNGPFTYQWYFNGVAIAGATDASYTVPSAQEFLEGSYTVVVTDAYGAIVSSPAVLSVSAPPPNNARLLNLSTRAQALTGDNILIPGFVVAGSGTKKLLIRAVGPTLKNETYKIASALENPRMTLKRLDFSVQPPVYLDVDANDDWLDNDNAVDIADAIEALFAFPFEDDREAALLVDLAPGQYTVFADGVGGTTGVAIVELYDADPSTGSGQAPAARLANISNRGFVGTGEAVMIPGFVISSGGPKTLLVRVVGPTLAGAPYNVPGTMADPKLTIYSGQTAILENDNWGDNPGAATTASTAQSLGAFALTDGSKDAAFVVTLPPGSYTVVGSSADGTSTGVVLVEVYVVP